jgi:hypothetical protein
MPYSSQKRDFKPSGHNQQGLPAADRRWQWQDFSAA